MTDLVKTLMSSGGGADFSPNDISGCVLHLDVSNSDCYSGSGTALNNLATEGDEPDFKTNGTPVFNGTAGVLGAHFEIDGASEYFNNDGAVGSVTKAMHKDLAEWTMIMLWMPAPSGIDGHDCGANSYLWSTNGGTSDSHGVNIKFDGGRDQINLFVMKGSAAQALDFQLHDQGSGLGADYPSLQFPGQPQMYALRYDEGGGAGGSSIWINHQEQQTFNAAGSANSSTDGNGFGLFAGDTGTGSIASGCLFYGALLYDRQLTDEEMQQLWVWSRARLYDSTLKQLWRVILTSTIDSGTTWGIEHFAVQISSVDQTPDMTQLQGQLIDYQDFTAAFDADTGEWADVGEGTNLANEGWAGVYFAAGVEPDGARLSQHTPFTPTADCDYSTDGGETWTTAFTGSGLTDGGMENLT